LLQHHTSRPLHHPTISAALQEVRFRNVAVAKIIHTGCFCGKKVLLVCQVIDFALGCQPESLARSVCLEIRAKLTLHNEAETHFEHLCLVDSFNGYDMLQTRDCVKLFTESHIRHFAEGAWMGQPLSTRISLQMNQSLPCTKATLPIYSIWQQVWLRTLANTKLSKSNKVLGAEAS